MGRGPDAGIARDDLTMGQVYHGLGLLARGETLLRKAIEFDQRIFGADSLELAETLDALVYTLADRG